MGKPSIWTTCGWICTWVVLSISVILCNKFILSNTVFKFPVALTIMHMVFSWLITLCLTKAGIAKVVDIERPVYVRYILPVAALFAMSLWLSNVAYCLLSVSFVQMLKALAPMVMYAASVLFGLDALTMQTSLIMIVVVMGVGTASIGEVEFDMLGTVANLGSIVAEVMRLVLLQKLSQQRGLRCDPLSSLFHISPASAVFLVPLLLSLEMQKLLALNIADVPVKTLLLSCTLAFVLNLTMYGVIASTSGVTMKMAGVVKDCLLVACSVMIYRSPVTTMQCIGYGVALAAVVWYTHLKQVPAAPARAAPDEEEPLIQPSASKAAPIMVVNMKGSVPPPLDIPATDDSNHPLTATGMASPKLSSRHSVTGGHSVRSPM